MEINNNTLIKLIVRQGTDIERKNIILASGEPAYTTDTHRFFVGTGNLSGGKVVGNITFDTTTDLTSLIPGVVGDLAFNSDDNTLNRIKTDDGSSLSSWEVVGGVYSSGNDHITIGSSNEIILNPLSANAASSDFVTGPIILDSGRIALSAQIPFTTVSTNTISVSSGLLATIDGLDVTNTPVNSLSSNLVIQSNQIYASYDGINDSVDYHKRLNSTLSIRLSTGHYRFTFGPLENSNYIPLTEIYGISNLDCKSRVISKSISSCDVVVLSSNGTKVNTNIMLSINY